MHNGNTGLSIVLSVIAMVASSVTTYLSFFDARYEVTAAVASTPSQVQTSSSRSGDEPLQVSYRVYVKPTVILSNEGTRSVVVTDVRLFKSEEAGACVAGDVFVTPYGENAPFIFEPGTVQNMTLEFGLPNMTADFEKKTENWCLGFTLFNHNGERTDATLSAAKADFEIGAPADADDAPPLSLTIETPKGPQRLAAGGWLYSVTGK